MTDSKKASRHGLYKRLTALAARWAAGDAKATPAPSGTIAAVSAPAPTQATTSVTSATAGVTPRTGGTLRALQAGDLASLDGHYYTTGNGLSVWLIYETLTVYDDNLKPQ